MECSPLNMANCAANKLCARARNEAKLQLKALDSQRQQAQVALEQAEAVHEAARQAMEAAEAKMEAAEQQVAAVQQQMDALQVRGRELPALNAALAAAEAAQDAATSQLQMAQAALSAANALEAQHAMMAEDMSRQLATAERVLQQLEGQADGDMVRVRRVFIDLELESEELDVDASLLGSIEVSVLGGPFVVHTVPIFIADPVATARALLAEISAFA